MNGQLKQQLMLLRSAVANVVDSNYSVAHITMAEIVEWIDDILGMIE